MSKLETPMTCRYWKRVGGTLIEEYLAVPSAPGVGYRRLDAVIILDGECRRASPAEKTANLDGHDIIIVQTKKTSLGHRRLGMRLLGQAYYSRKLILRCFSPKSLRTVALCSGDDPLLREFAQEDDIEVVIDNAAPASHMKNLFSAASHPGFDGHNTITVRSNRRLGMYLMGEARYSRKLLEKSLGRPVRVIARCAKDDAILRPIAEADGIKVVVVPPAGLGS